MRRPWFFASLFAVLVLLVAACPAGNEADSYATADEIIESIDQPVTRTVDSDDCIRTVVIDEYGFETETAVCAPTETDVQAEGDVTPDQGPQVAEGVDRSIDADAMLSSDSPLPLDLFAALIGDVPDADLRRPLAALSLLLDELDASCGIDPEVWTAGVETAAAEIHEIAVSFEAAIALEGEAAQGEAADGEAAGYVGSSSARLLVRALQDRTLLLTGCQGGSNAPLAAASPTGLRINVATATVATSVDRLGRVLGDSGTNPLFFHPDELAHLRWMRSTTETVEFVVVGTSQATHGISPIQLGDASGRVVGSVAIPGSVAEVQQYWLPTVLEAIDPATIIWAIGPVDLVVGCTDDGRGATFDAGRARRAASFERFGWLSDLSPVDRILGPPGNEVYLETQTGQLAAERYPGNRLGEAVRLLSISQVAIDDNRTNFGPAFEGGKYCEARAALIRSVVEDLQADGREVVFVGMPTSPDLAALYPGGSDALTLVMERFRAEVAEPTAAAFADLTGAIQEPRYWSDWVHPVAEGSVEYTAIVAAALADLEVW